MHTETWCNSKNAVLLFSSRPLGQKWLMTDAAGDCVILKLVKILIDEDERALPKHKQANILLSIELFVKQKGIGSLLQKSLDFNAGCSCSRKDSLIKTFYLLTLMLLFLIPESNFDWNLHLAVCVSSVSWSQLHWYRVSVVTLCNKQLVVIKMNIKVIDKQYTLWRRAHSLVLHGGGRPLLWLMWHKTAITNLEQSNQCVPIFTSNVVPVCVPSSMTFNIQPLRSSLYGWYFVMTLDPCIKTILESSYCMYWYCHVIQYVFHSLLSLCSSPSTNINLWFNSMGLV